MYGIWFAYAYVGKGNICTSEVVGRYKDYWIPYGCDWYAIYALKNSAVNQVGAFGTLFAGYDSC